MYEPDWRDLAQEGILPDVEAAMPNDKLRGRKLVDLRPVIAHLPFYRHTSLVAFEEPNVPAPNQRFFLWSPKAGMQTLNWTNEPIYTANDADGMALSAATLPVYARFFFHFVRGQLGRFIIVESDDEITWMPEGDARENAEAKIRTAGIDIAPVQYVGVHNTEELHVMRAYCVFKNALFRTYILVAPYKQEVFLQEEGEEAPESFTLGQMKLINEELLLEELPVPIHPPPSEFG